MAKMNNGKAPAVVVRGDLNGLGVVRSLTSANVPVNVIDVSRNRPAMWSRGARRTVAPALHGRGLIDSLFELQQRLRVRPVLFLTDEAAVITVSKFHEELRQAYLFQASPLDLVGRLENKARFHEFAASAGLPIPSGVVVSTEEEIARIDGLTEPFIIKPADKTFVYFGKTERLHIAKTREQAKNICARLVSTIGECVVQEWIPGPDSNIGFCLFYKGSEERNFIAFTGRKLRATPPGVGSTAACVAAPEWHEELSEITLRYIEAANYRGLGSVEFKRNEATGAFQIIEPTVGRTDWQEEIATLCGVNIPLFAYESETGGNGVAESDLRDVGWSTSLNLARWGDAQFEGRRIFDGYWRNDDPLPALVYYSNAITRRAGALSNRALNFLARNPSLWRSRASSIGG